MDETQMIRYEHFEICTRPDGKPWELGRGAMGVTYRAIDTNLHVEVALKVISEKCFANPTSRKRFEREARAAARLRHPNIADVYHFGTGEHESYYTMELVNGETVEDIIRRDGPIETRMALEIVLQISRALSAAEKLRIVHRDLKPANIMITELDGDIFVKVIDFGLAKQLDNPLDAGVTMRGFVGTPHFASPEQLNERRLDTRADIYSLGATLWHMLAGHPPFTGTVVQIVSQHLSAPAPMETLGNQPPATRELLKSMLAKDAADRPQTAAELRQRTLDALAEASLGASVWSTASSFPATDTYAVETLEDVTDAGETEEPLLPTPPALHSYTPEQLVRITEPELVREPRKPGRSRLVALVVGAVAAIGIAAVAGIWFADRAPGLPKPVVSPAVPPAKTPVVVADSTPVAEDFPTRVDRAWSEGRYDDAISLASGAWPPIPDSHARIDDMVKKALAGGASMASQPFRNAILDAAEAGSPEAMFTIAVDVADEHPSRAILWYERAARLGHVRAMTKLGLLCAKGYENHPPDFGRAIPWFRKASEAGDADGQFALAECYLRDLGKIGRDARKAVELLKKAADQQNPLALDLLGTCYSKGEGTTKDFDQAFRCYSDAVALGFARSLANLGVLYMNGQGPSRRSEPAKAVELFKRGAAANDPNAMTLLATCYEKGQGVGADPKLAEKWFVAAAKTGDPRALAWCRKRGIQVATES